VTDSHHDHAGTGELTVKVEPDEVPTGMLTKLAVIVTLVIIGSVGFAKILFDHTLANELTAKGYVGETSVPATQGSARTWE
jgi:hypothetical protein